MKKTIFALVFALLCSFSFGQTILKGSLVGVHVLAPDLKEGLTMQEFADFVQNKWLPEYNKIFPDLKGYLVKSIRGQDSSSLGIIFIAKNETARNKYWTSDNTLTPAVQKATDKMIENLRKGNEEFVAVLFASHIYNDWIVQ